MVSCFPPRCQTGPNAGAFLDEVIAELQGREARQAPQARADDGSASPRFQGLGHLCPVEKFSHHPTTKGIWDIYGIFYP